MSISLMKSCLFLGTTLSLAMAQPTLQPCPKEVKDLPAETTCWSGQDEMGAYYWIAKPKNWNGDLILHAHGGPALGQAKLSRATSDLKRWSIWPRDGFALAITSYRAGGVAVMSAAEDVARLLPIATSVIGTPKKVILHGQSWGASVAARAAEIDGPLSKVKPKVDAVLLTSGVLAGGSKSYDFRIDLRAVWQAVCNNHPRPNEIQYPLWQGLPKDAKPMSKEDMKARVDECLGLDKPITERTAQQKDNLKTIMNVIKIHEKNIQGHLTWATNHFQDIVWNRLNGKNPFSNDTVKYAGSSNDAKLNQKVVRYKADPEAFAAFAKDTDPTGNIAQPILTMRAIDDPIAFVELADTWEQTVAKAGHSKNMVQLYTDDHEHSYLTDAQYVAAMNALLAWVDQGKKPTPIEVEKQCKTLDAKWDPSKECHIVPEFKPSPLSTRVPVR